MNITSLGYVKMESPNAQEWEDFGPNVLGLALADQAPPGTVLLKTDDRHHRISIEHGQRNRVKALGWEVASANEFEHAVESLERAGVPAKRGTDEECGLTRVRDMVRFSDPSGFTHEVFYGQLDLPASFRPGRGISGFVTGAQGLGHVVLSVPDLDAAVGFYCHVLGFRVSDEVDGTPKLVFFHVNARHHSLAAGGFPGIRGMHHIMLQTKELDDVGLTYDLCQERGVPITMKLGRHTNDRMFSFYLRTPSGFDIEYGWDGREVDDRDWIVTSLATASIWGHQVVDPTPPGCMERVD